MKIVPRGAFFLGKSLAKPREREYYLGYMNPNLNPLEAAKRTLNDGNGPVIENNENGNETGPDAFDQYRAELVNNVNEYVSQNAGWARNTEIDEDEFPATKILQGGLSRHNRTILIREMKDSPEMLYWDAQNFVGLGRLEFCQAGPQKGNSGYCKFANVLIARNNKNWGMSTMEREYIEIDKEEVEKYNMLMSQSPYSYPSPLLQKGSREYNEEYGGTKKPLQSDLFKEGDVVSDVKTEGENCIVYITDQDKKVREVVIKMNKGIENSKTE